MTTTAFRTPGVDGPEGTEWRRRRGPHPYCLNGESHLPHGMSTQGYTGQTCGGIPIPVEPRECRRCGGNGLVSEYVGVFLREVRCDGENDLGECDGGIVR